MSSSVTLETREGQLFIGGHKVLRGWESFSGWYWFGVEKAYTQDSIINGEVVENDQIWFGFVQGQVDEWGYFSQGELESIRSVWPIKACDLPYAGRRGTR